MPKLKSKKSASKRFKKTASGKFKFKHAYLRHILTHKGNDQKRELRKGGILASCDEKRMKKLLPYA